MASRALAQVAMGPADYERVYDRVLSQARQPVILHWLGDMFDPALAGYWARDLDSATDTCSRSSPATPTRSTASKPLLDDRREIAMRGCRRA
jgi:hypothetical protein